MRLSPPVLYLIRTCTKAVWLRDVEIREGQRVVVGVASANRDESVYEESARFWTQRANPAPHLSFGHGQHFCIGAPLARLEAQLAVESFLDRVAPAEVRLAPGFRNQWMQLP